MTGEAALLLKAVSPGDADAVFAAGAKAVKSGLEAEALPLLEQAARAPSRRPAHLAGARPRPPQARGSGAGGGGVREGGRAGAVGRR